MKSKSVMLCSYVILALSCGPCLQGVPYLSGEQPLLPTPAEEAAYLKYTQNDAIAAFLSALDARSPELAVMVVGRTLPTDEYGAKDIFLAVLSERFAATPEALDLTKPTVLASNRSRSSASSATGNMSSCPRREASSRSFATPAKPLPASSPTGPGFPDHRAVRNSRAPRTVRG